MRRLNTCTQCNYEWFSNLMEGQLPVACPSCRSRQWLKGRKRRTSIPNGSNLFFMSVPGESWHRIKDYESYLISSIGRIFSLKTNKLISGDGKYVQLYDIEGKPKNKIKERLERAEPFPITKPEY